MRLKLPGGPAKGPLTVLVVCAVFVGSVLVMLELAQNSDVPFGVDVVLGMTGMIAALTIFVVAMLIAGRERVESIGPSRARTQAASLPALLGTGIATLLLVISALLSALFHRWEGFAMFLLMAAIFGPLFALSISSRRILNRARMQRLFRKA